LEACGEVVLCHSSSSLKQSRRKIVDHCHTLLLFSGFALLLPCVHPQVMSVVSVDIGRDPNLDAIFCWYFSLFCLNRHQPTNGTSCSSTVINSVGTYVSLKLATDVSKTLWIWPSLLSARGW
jgi:hypothetical protein